MRVPESWLRSLVPTSLTLEEISDQLTMAGLEVEEIVMRAPPFTGVVLGKILSAERHPDADRLQVCQVSVGGGQTLQIVCGAPNARAGLYVACATDGAELPGGFKIKKTKMRGVASEGMLCSTAELGLSSAAEGIVELNHADEQLGQDIRSLMKLNEASLVIKLTPNRADCLSMLGVARELSAITQTPMVLPPELAISLGQQSAGLSCEGQAPALTIAQDPNLPALCGRFAARTLHQVDASAPTPDFMVERLELAGQRSISILVDISNYLMLLTGQPSHAFDLDQLSLDQGLQARWGRAGETLRLLNETDLELDPYFGVVADDRGPQALAGILGGQNSAVSSQTQNILVEAAFWEPDAIRGRSQRLKFSTDAAHRFERGVDPELPLGLLDAFAALVVAHATPAGQQVRVSPIQDTLVQVPARPPVRLRLSRCEKILGRPYSAELVSDVFARLGFEQSQATVSGDTVFTVTPPSHRFDLAIEEDLIEEVARMVGFDAIPVRPPRAELTMQLAPEAGRSSSELRASLAALDYHEVVSYSFISADMAAHFEPDLSRHLNLLNPIAEQLSVMRPSLIPGLLKVLVDNQARRESRVRVFEVGRRFQRDASVVASLTEVAGVAQPLELGLLAWGSALPDQWAAPARPVDFFDLKHDLMALVPGSSLEVRKPAVTPPYLHPGRAGEVFCKGASVGMMGELHPSLVQSLGLGQAPLVACIRLEALLDKPMPAPAPPPKTPAMVRDLAFLMDQSVPSAEVVQRLMKSSSALPKGKLLQSIEVFDDYRGKGLEAHQKSLGLRFTFQDAERTLEDAEVEALLSALADQVLQKFQATVRGSLVK